MAPPAALVSPPPHSSLNVTWRGGAWCDLPRPSSPPLPLKNKIHNGYCNERARCRQLRLTWRGAPHPEMSPTPELGAPGGLHPHRQPLGRPFAPRNSNPLCVGGWGGAPSTRVGVDKFQQCSAPAAACGGGRCRGGRQVAAATVPVSAIMHTCRIVGPAPHPALLGAATSPPVMPGYASPSHTPGRSPTCRRLPERTFDFEFTAARARTHTHTNSAVHNKRKLGGRASSACKPPPPPLTAGGGPSGAAASSSPRTARSAPLAAGWEAGRPPELGGHGGHPLANRRRRPRCAPAGTPARRTATCAAARRTVHSTSGRTWPGTRRTAWGRRSSHPAASLGRGPPTGSARS